ncbi:hypothetical protein [Halonotius roseus]|uniref:Uncharacterized protein n=1 Tax=Halonotius roseus TaxID=2511997 RepID=A0A544QL78_9EURY|nr:hypothetical protein [Halonotius roseus]TQQ79361.1 hypothetical protein EWF95_10075 [Halonotius roseus]
MHTNDNGHYAAAVAALADRRYEAAGDASSRAGWAVLADPRDDQDPFAPDDRGAIGDGLRHLLTAALCYRVADRPARATRRATAGIAAAGDLGATMATPVQAACFDEFAADFRVAGGLDGAADAYADAAAAYRAAADETTDPQTVGATSLFLAAAAPAKQLARTLDNGEIAIEWEDLHGSDPSDPGDFLAARAEYKRQRFPSLVDGCVDRGVLAAPRGTTEYATDHHACPACGSRDVNWIADSTLCLRCSRPTEPQ